MSVAITLIYPFRNRDILRIQKSFNSLLRQSNSNFEVFFVDYGSDNDVSYEVQQLLSGYTFVTYLKSYTQEQPWNKSRAINIALKQITSDFVFISDVDMFYKENFIATLYALLDLNKVLYFKIGYLDAVESLKNIAFEEYKILKYSNAEATGLTLFPTQKLKLIGGFDEFYHFWGSEDTDVHVRMSNQQIQVDFYDNEILMLHQYHDSFHKKQKLGLDQLLVPKDIVRYNYTHQEFHLNHKIIKVNKGLEGGLVTKNQIDTLKTKVVKIFNLSNEQVLVNYYLNEVIDNQLKGVYKFQFQENKQMGTSLIKTKLKQFLKKKIIKTYTLKQINDLIIYKLISQHRFKLYSYTINNHLLALYIEL